MQHRPATIAGETTPGQQAPRGDPALVADLVYLGSEIVVRDVAVVAQGGRARGRAITSGVSVGRS